MTVDEWYLSRKGQVLLVPSAPPEDAGQCVQAADYALNEIYGLPYVWANAIDWWNNFDSIPQLKNNFDKITDGSLTKGSFVIFNQKVGSIYGHIDIVPADGTTSYFTGYDSNWEGNKTLHTVIHQGAQFVQGSLRPKGNQMATEEFITTAWQAGFNRGPRPDEMAAMQGKTELEVEQHILANNELFRSKAANYDALAAEFDAYKLANPPGGFTPLGQEVFVKA